MFSILKRLTSTPSHHFISLQASASAVSFSFSLEKVSAISMLHEQLAATGAVGTSDLSPQARPPAPRHDTTARIGFPRTQTRQTSPLTGAGAPQNVRRRARVVSASAQGSQRNRRSGVNLNWVITASKYFHRLVMVAETTGRVR